MQKGWRKGYQDQDHAYLNGYSQGYMNGYKRGHQEGYAEGGGSCSGGGGGGNGTRSSEDVWKLWKEKYTAADEDKDPLFMVPLVYPEDYPGRKITLTVYPEEIQEQLRAKYALIEGGSSSQQIVYDMTAGWRYTIRLFDEREKKSKDWERELRKITYYKCGWKCVGAQWRMNSHIEECAEGITDRPVFLYISTMAIERSARVFPC